MPAIAVIGGGIVGLATAHALLEAGHDVTVIDRDPDGDKCSWGNAGAIAAPEIIPAASLGVIRRIPFWLADPLGPLALRPAHAPAMLPFLRRFAAAARASEIARITTALAALNTRALADSTALFTTLGIAHALHRVGALAVYESAKALAHERPEYLARRRLGFDFRELSGDEAREMEPALSPRITAGVFMPDWTHVDDPREIWAALLARLRDRGVPVLRQEVSAIEASGTLRFAGSGRAGFDRIVVAGGAWSARLARCIGDRALLESERGYNTTVADPGVTLSREVIFAERKFVATPLSIGLRIGGAAEFAGLDAPPNYKRSARLRQLARHYLPGLSDAPGKDWMGHRPTTPDTLPVIGPSPHAPRILYAFGHGHLGLTQAATTAQLVAGIIAGTPAPLDLDPFSIARFGGS
jgi:D-amino-acid dehydrogenase